jgi:hypothetical protein
VQKAKAVKYVQKVRRGPNGLLTHTRRRMQTWPHPNTAKTQTMLKGQKAVNGKANNGKATEVAGSGVGSD